jgi:hypothetical protein
MDPANRFVPVWSANRGVQLMARVALASLRLEAAAVAGLDDLAPRLSSPNPPRAVLAGLEDLRAAGVTPAALAASLPADATLIVLGAPRPGDEPSGPRVRLLRLPFTVAEVTAALGPAYALPAPHPAAAAEPVRPAFPPAVPALPVLDADAVRAEVGRVVAAIARPLVEAEVRRIVPELAEAIIKDELARLLRDASDAAVADGPGTDEG